MIQKSFTIANLLIVVIGVYVGVGIFYGRLESMLQAKPAVPDYQVQAQAFNPEVQNPESHYQLILTRNIFNLKAGKDDEQGDAGLDVNALDQTSLSLLLWGTVSGFDQETYAVIEDTSTREQKLYRKGDQVQSAVIKMILREKVILSVRGKDEVLEMQKDEEPGGMMGGSSPYGRASAAMGASGGMMPSQQISLQRSMIQESIQDINKLMTQVKIMPNLENGEPNGLSVSNIQPNSIFRRMGLRNGDIIMGVDGQTIQSVDDALKLYQNLVNADGVKLQLKRRGRERSIDYSIR